MPPHEQPGKGYVPATSRRADNATHPETIRDRERNSNMRLGYNTNGTAFHRWQDALTLMAEIGYQSVAIMVDVHCLNPYSDRFTSELEEMRALLGRLGLSSVIETGARFLLDPRRKHEPTLVSPSREERSRRIDFLKRCIDIAAELGSEAVSFWSGASREPISQDILLERLVAGCRQVLDYAADRNVRLAFEPEPGMVVERLDQFHGLLTRVDAPHFGLTMDVGHVHCVEDGPISEHVRRWTHRIFNIHIEDMRRGIHEHLRFGEGEIDFAPIIQTLRQIGYTGPVHVELSRHSHVAPEVMRESFGFLSRLTRLAENRT